MAFVSAFSGGGVWHFRKKSGARHFHIERQDKLVLNRGWKSLTG